jgi:hypothetical protein
MQTGAQQNKRHHTHCQQQKPAYLASPFRLSSHVLLKRIWLERS